MFKRVISAIPTILNNLPVEIAKKAVDAALDVIEDTVKESPNKIDDAIVLPLVKIIRVAGNIPDDDS